MQGPGYDTRREQYATQAIGTWVAGRLAMTRTRLSCIVNRPGPGGASFSIDLTEIEAVEISGGRLQRVVTLRTADRVVHLRTTGPDAFAKRVAIAREAAQDRARR